MQSVANVITPILFQDFKSGRKERNNLRNRKEGNKENMRGRGAGRNKQTEEIKNKAVRKSGKINGKKKMQNRDCVGNQEIKIN